MRIIRFLTFILTFSLGISSALASHYNWPVHRSFTILNTVSTLQFYGGSIPGFHHGLDIHAPAGTPIYAPVGGIVGLGYYYPRAKVPFTFGIFIQGDDGYRWEFHHVDKATIPERIIELAKRHGHVKRGTLLGRIYDAPKFDPSIPPHVHVNVIDRNGFYNNPLRFFPPLADKTPPKIRGIYIVDANNHVVAQTGPRSKSPTLLPAGKYELVLDVLDIIDGAPKGDSIAYLAVSANGKSIGTLNFLDHLPKRNFLKGVRESYKIEPIVLLDGRTLKNQVELSEPRRFLYRFDLDTSKIPVRADSSSTIRILARDFAGNSTHRSFELRISHHR